MEEQYIKWKAFEHEHKEHSINWFWTVGTLSLAISVASFIFGNILFGLLVLVAVVALFLQSIRKPKKVTFGVGETNIQVGDKKYPYKYLESFGVTEESILIKSKKKLMPFIILPLPPEEYQENIYEILSSVLTEEEHEEPVAEKIMEQLGF